MYVNWNYPTNVRVGVGRLQEVSTACRELGMTAPLLVTDPGLLAFPMVDQTVELCRAAGLACRVFSAIKSNPTGANVEKGTRSYHEGNHDGVIAHLRDTVANQVAIDQPRYSGLATALSVQD